MISCHGLSDIGLKRKKNEDHFLSLPSVGFFALADGMGGHRAGEIASKMVLSSLSESITSFRSRDPLEVIIDLRYAIQKANQILVTIGEKNHSFLGMGSTLCCLFWLEELIVYAHVGDSRIYRFRDQKLSLLTQDHSLFSKWLATRRTSHTPYPYKNVITKAMGMHESLQPEIAFSRVHPQDLYLLCTDGLSDVLTLSEMEEILQEDAPLDMTTKKMIESAKKRQGSDNMTVLMIQKDS